MELRSDDLGEQGAVERRPGQHGKVARARVPRVVEPVRRGEPGVVEVQPAGLGVHLRDEALDGAGDVFRERHGGIVGRLQEQGVQQVLDRDPLPRDQPELRGAGRARRRRGLGTHRHHVRGVRALDDDEPRHDLRDAGDGTALLGLRSPQDPAGVQVGQDGRPGRHRRRLVRWGRRPQGIGEGGGRRPPAGDGHRRRRGRPDGPGQADGGKEDEQRGQRDERDRSSPPDPAVLPHDEKVTARSGAAAGCSEGALASACETPSTGRRAR